MAGFFRAYWQGTVTDPHGRERIATVPSPIIEDDGSLPRDVAGRVGVWLRAPEWVLDTEVDGFGADSFPDRGVTLHEVPDATSATAVAMAVLHEIAEEPYPGENRAWASEVHLDDAAASYAVVGYRDGWAVIGDPDGIEDDVRSWHPSRTPDEGPRLDALFAALRAGHGYADLAEDLQLRITPEPWQPPAAPRRRRFWR